LLLISEKKSPKGLAEIHYRDLPYGSFAPPPPPQLIFANFNIHLCTFIGLLYLNMEESEQEAAGEENQMSNPSLQRE
jgi:hypothetical protein